MADIVVKVPPTVDERVADLIAEAISKRLKSLAYVNEILMNSELTEEDAIELGRKAKKGRGRYLERKYSFGN
ncbi:hypothetical protein JCM16138_08260 [Thermococcus atlanticus]